MSKATIRLGASGKVLNLPDGSHLDLEEFRKGDLHILSNSLSEHLGITGKQAQPPRRGPRRHTKGTQKNYGRRKEGPDHRAR